MEVILMHDQNLLLLDSITMSHDYKVQLTNYMVEGQAITSGIEIREYVQGLSVLGVTSIKPLQDDHIA